MADLPATHRGHRMGEGWPSPCFRGIPWTSTASTRKGTTSGVSLTARPHLTWRSLPTWSPDGSRIAYASLHGQEWDVHVINADGSGGRRLTTAAGMDWEPAWSPDGSRIAFVSKRDGNNEIYVMDADGSDQTNITNHSASDTAPSWSPDGSMVAFASDREGGTYTW